MATGWSMERRRRQAELILTWRPWEQSTGPRTEAGKQTVSRNAWRGGQRERLRDLARVVNEELTQMRQLAQLGD